MTESVADKKADFIFCIHNHQPVGNFVQVLESSYIKAYLPFLKAVVKRPWFKLSFHSSGFLLDWIVKEHPEFIDIIRGLVLDGRAEVIGGGYFEPILSVLPERDRVAQITRLSERIEALFTERPRGLWLAERIWEPTLPTSLKAAGVEFVVLDDYHFIKAGLTEEDLNGYYTTEDQGAVVKVFAGSERLRYLIPFRPALEAGEFLSRSAKKGGAVIYADDGEKFGVWPKTYEWVYEEGWLEDFLDEIEGRLDSFKPSTFSEFIDTNASLGSVYLPTTSYMEMGGWALPPTAAKEFAELEAEVSLEDKAHQKRFIKGGYWRNFFSKYPESNWMHKRMLMASERVEGTTDKGKDEAQEFLYKAQCNDAFWHGVFGGLYLPHLRGALYENIIKAECATGEVETGVELIDVDADGLKEAVLSAKEVKLFINPAKGGVVEEIDFLPGAINLSNTLTRREEGYHHRLVEASEVAVTSKKDKREGVESIHDLDMDPEEVLKLVGLLKFDSEKRASFRDRLISRATTLKEFERREYEDALLGSCYELTTGNGEVTLSCASDSTLTPSVEKSFKIVGPASFEAAYQVSGASSDSERLFGVEINLMLPASDGPLTRYEFDGALGGGGGPLYEKGEVEGISRVSLVDDFSKIRVDILQEGMKKLWYHPIETVSQSEAGFERIFQGVSLFFSLELNGPLSPKFIVTVSETDKGGKVDETLRKKAAKIKLLILDVDGVMTDGSINYTDSGDEFKSFNVKDGHGIKLLMRTGTMVALITARSSNVVTHRAKDLGIEHLIQGAKEKLPAFEGLIKELGLTSDEVAYMGDDLVDLPVIRRVALSGAPLDAVKEVREAVDIVTTAHGGKGAVREFAELIIRGLGKFDELTARYYK